MGRIIMQGRESIKGGQNPNTHITRKTYDIVSVKKEMLSAKT